MSFMHMNTYTNLVAAVFSYKNIRDFCPSGYSGEHKPLHYAKLTFRKPNFGISGTTGRVLEGLQNYQVLHCKI